MELLGTTTVVEAVALALRRQLLDGSLPPGHVLRDTELVDQFAVARPTVRAAVQALVNDGLLVRDRGRSARVPQFSGDDIADLFFARSTIEVAALERIAASRPSLGPLVVAFDRFAGLPASASWQEAADLDVGFHQTLVTIADSPRLLRLFESLANEARLVIASTRPMYESIAELVEEHREVLDALRHRRYGRAKQLLAAHNERAVADLTSTIEETA